MCQRRGVTVQQPATLLSRLARQPLRARAFCSLPTHAPPPNYITSPQQRARSRRIAQQRGAARVLTEAEARRKAAGNAAAARERAMSVARGKLAGQEEADRAALEVGDGAFCCLFVGGVLVGGVLVVLDAAAAAAAVFDTASTSGNCLLGKRLSHISACA